MQSKTKGSKCPKDGHGKEGQIPPKPCESYIRFGELVHCFSPTTPSLMYEWFKKSHLWLVDPSYLVDSLGNGGHPGLLVEPHGSRKGIHMSSQPRISKERWFAFIQQKQCSEVWFEFALKEISYPRAVGTKTNPQNELLFCRGPNEVFDRSVKCCKLGAMKIGVAIVPFICSFG